ncbi:hypothetical protein, partial [uncultured Megasphaera sp.]|uniref:hypothetical protein n=1 Tax=uncultured Megasphaera sp. TaxID=165188 RepID=UPI00266CD373
MINNNGGTNGLVYKEGHWYFYSEGTSGDGESGWSYYGRYLDLGTSPFGNSSTLSDEQKQIVKDLIKNVDGDQTVNGNQTTTGSSETKGNSTTDGSSTVKGDQTVGGTTNTTNLNVSGDTNLHNTTITGDSHVTNNQTVDGSSTVKGDSNVGGNENVSGTTTTKELHV